MDWRLALILEQQLASQNPLIRPQRMASLLAPYRNPDALEPARDLDMKVELCCGKEQPKEQRE
jgi:hypothetical protein